MSRKKNEELAKTEGDLIDEGAQPSVQQTGKLPDPGQVREVLERLDRRLWERTSVEKVTRGLGVFSLGLGLLELLAPRLVARIAGAKGKMPGLVRLFGLREILSGLLIFSQGKRPETGDWSRVFGDFIDLAALGLILMRPKSNKFGALFAAANVLAITQLDIMTAREMSRLKGKLTDDGKLRVQRSIFVNRPPQELYDRWKNFEELPTFMRHLVSVYPRGSRRLHWATRGPGGTVVEWDAEVIEDRPGELISWRSLPGAEVINSGTVRFELVPPERGTIVHVEMEYCPPAGVIGAQVAKLFREDPSQQLKDDLYRFKQIAETGEIVRSDASPEGSGSIKQRPAQPLPSRNYAESHTDDEVSL